VTSRLAVITPEDTILTLSDVSAVASGGAQPVSARLVDDDGQPLAGLTVTFRLGGATAEATTGADGTATASLAVPVLATGTARLEAAFSGDAWYRPSSAATTVLVAQPTSFVIWGGNTPGLRLGDRVQFWGAQWSRQVQSGDYAAQADFKGWSTAPLPPRLCQPTAHTTGTPRLDASCWISKPGNSNPPAKLGSYVQMIVATSIAKNGSTIYGNIAATVVLQVDTSSAYGPDPGHPGYGTVIGVLEDGAGVFASSAVSSMSAQAATATRRISLYSPEMSLMTETELTTAARPAILYEYIWFDGRPLAQVDGAGTVSWTFTDHLGTPLLQTSSLQGIVWRAEHEPYGSIYALRSYDRHQPLRFPGQEAEQLGTGANGVTERSYNVHRWYRAGWGRYTQADPLGLRGGQNLYIYSRGNPVRFSDAMGLLVQLYCAPVGQGGGFSPSDPAGWLGFRHCFVRIKCGCADNSYDLRLEVVGQDDETGLAKIPEFPPTFSSDHGGIRTAVLPPDSNSNDCKMETCIMKEYQRRRKVGQPYGEGKRGWFQGPNSNTFADDILRACGVSEIFWPAGVTPFTSR
jgi:RHS repeat-associated protein